ncbi:probable ubiquitin carboxyl-terminal hydrolase creB [Fundulus heteroclitus]|uniref:probable ubiquitin carboxyl-terminal hydrolase creB n=1 Tax=Fundulus heteroclitus TaxID=8078 RepID=UPI00165B0424|nr:probable ubiquitin carboxyl-terminal hydrolase creB [Fundulus heteroclitus]
MSRNMRYTAKLGNYPSELMGRKRKQGKANYDHPAGKRYHGLKNQGATCYLNSVLQVLYMTKDFREAVSLSPKLEPGFIDHRLRSIFNALTNTTATTHEITNHLGIKKVNEQQDAAECFDKILSCCSSKASEIFKGELTVRNKCSQCEREKRTISPFWSLPLTLSDKKYYCVSDGIQKYFQESKICGENQLYCCQCSGKTDSSIKLDMHHHPDVLTLLLKRFKFDYQAMDYVKIKCHVKIPEKLKIPAVEDESQTYRLYALVEHSGELRSGHYTARIRSQDDDKWYTFNDSTVTLEYQLFQLEEKETSPGAYLLFYRKTTATGPLNPDSSGASTSGCTKTNEPRRKDAESKGRREGERAATDSFGVREETQNEGEMKTEVVARDDLSKMTTDGDSLKSTSNESLEVRKPSGRNIKNNTKCSNSKRFDGQSRYKAQDGSGNDFNQDLNSAQSKKRKGKQSTKGHGLDSKQDVSENCPGALCAELKETERKDQRGHEQTQRIRALERHCSKTGGKNQSLPSATVDKSGLNRAELQEEQHEHCGCNKYSEVQDSAGEDNPKLNQQESKNVCLDHCVERGGDEEIIKESDERSHNKHQQSKTNNEEENKVENSDRLVQNSSLSSHEGKEVNPKKDKCCQIRENSEGLVGEREGNQKTVQDEDGQNNLQSDTQQNINPVTQEMAANMDPNTQNGSKATGGETLSEQQRHSDENESTGRENIEDVNENKSLSESNLVKTTDVSPDAKMQREGGNGSGKTKKSKKGQNRKESVVFSRGLTCLRGRNTNPEGSQRQSSFQNNRNTI